MEDSATPSSTKKNNPSSARASARQSPRSRRSIQHHTPLPPARRLHVTRALRFGSFTNNVGTIVRAFMLIKRRRKPARARAYVLFTSARVVFR
jgi:hypothetical protein